MPDSPYPAAGALMSRFTAGYLEANAHAVAVATKSGLFAYHRTIAADFCTTVRTPDGTGSGWAPAGARLGRDRSGRGRTHRGAEGGGEPESAGDRTGALHRRARTAGGERSDSAARQRAQRAERRRKAEPFSKPGGGDRIGEKVADERVTLYLDPADPMLLAQPFTDEGLPTRRIVRIEKGVLRNLVPTRF